MKLFLEAAAYAAIISAPFSMLGWMVTSFLLMQAKQEHLSVEQQEALQKGDMNVAFLVAFARTAAMRADRRISRLTISARALFFWPIGAVILAAVIFRLLGINQP